ncbi:MAG: CvpA family protein [Holosporaceae bacterium]|jgi:membrane protein required for colicin V production|nr:CvpA family protein [Holosporaceae bacterium]
MKNSEFFNFLDYIYIALMFFFTVSGFVRGFIKDFFGTCAWYCSGFIAVWIAPYLIPIVAEQVKNVTLVRVVSIAVSYLAVLIVLLLIINIISQSVKHGMLSGIDRAFGVLFGLFKSVGVFICLHALMITFEFQKDKYSFLRNSKLSSIFFNVAELLMPSMIKLGLISDVRKLSSQKKKKAIIEESLQITKKRSEEKVGITDKLKNLIIDPIVKLKADYESDETLPITQTSESLEETPNTATKRQHKKTAKLKRTSRKHLDSSAL